jgi:predicted NBD/HSP70 family sugar kinase
MPVADGSYEEETVSEVRKVTIETVARGTASMHHINANVNVGGSLVDVSCDSEGDPELQGLVDRLQDKLRALAIEAVNTSLHSS